MAVEGVTIALLLNRLADALDIEFGPHPVVPLTKVKEIAGQLVATSEFKNKDEVLAVLTMHINAAYQGSGLPLT